MTDDPIKFIVDVKFGTVESKQFYRQEGDALVYYSYKIERDLDGVETMRTEPKALSRLILH